MEEIKPGPQPNNFGLNLNPSLEGSISVSDPTNAPVAEFPNLQLGNLSLKAMAYFSGNQ